METSIENYKLYARELELKAILEVTQAINNNLPEDALYKIYHFTLRANLNISRLCLYVWEEKWKCKVCYGTKNDYHHINLPIKTFLSKLITNLPDISLSEEFEEFSLLIPVFHKDVPVACVLVNIPEAESADTAFIQTLTNIIIVAIENKKLAGQQLAQEALKKELEIAKAVQTQLFPKKLPQYGNIQVKADYYPHQIVGGDYYDYIQIDKDQFLFCIADASGKGISAALLMSNFQAALRALIRQTTDLKKILNELNYLIFQNTGGERFITFFCALYNTNEKKFKYINAGHNPPVFLKSQGAEPEFLEKGTIVLGALNQLPFLHETIFDNIEDFLLFTYTDGLTESTNHNDDEFGSDRIIDFINTNRELNPEQIHEGLMKDLSDFCDGKVFSDDVTLLTCKVC